MNDNNDGIFERWQIDTEILNSGPRVKTKQPQCFRCKYREAGNLMHCEKYTDKEKEDYIIYCERECKYYSAVDNIDVKSDDKAKNKKMGALFGFVVGDALGVPVEFEDRQKRVLDKVEGMRAYGTYGQPFGTWSDDTSLMLALIDAFLNGYSLSKLADNCVDFYRNAKFTPYNNVFDIGNTTINAIENIERGIPLNKCGGNTEYDNGNGSLMRILPLGLVWKQYDVDERIKQIEEVSAITHAHSRSKFACIIYSSFINELMVSNDKEIALDKTISFVNEMCEQQYKDEFDVYNRILSKSLFQEDGASIKSSGYVVDSLEAAMWCFMKYDTFDDVVLAAVNLGGDTDTIAAIAGGMAGSFYGVESIPDRWIQILAQKEQLKMMFDAFIEYSK